MSERATVKPCDLDVEPGKPGRTDEWGVPIFKCPYCAAAGRFRGFTGDMATSFAYADHLMIEHFRGRECWLN